MYRDQRDAQLHQAELLRREVELLREQNDAMREKLLAQRRGPEPVAPLSIYQVPIWQLSAGDRAALGTHRLEAFPVWAAVVLHLFTFGIFSIVHFGRAHGQLPRATHDDPSTARAIGLSFVPYFNLYWVFFFSQRLCDRLNLQLALRDSPSRVDRGLMLAMSIATVIPYLNVLVGFPILGSIAVAHVQRRINELVELGPSAVPAVITQTTMDPTRADLESPSAPAGYLEG